MYPPKGGQEYHQNNFPSGYPPPQQITTGYPPPPLNPYAQPPPPNHYAPPPQNRYVSPPPPNPYAQVPYGSQGLTQWSSSLFACTEDLSNCCLTCFCPCITFGQIAEIVDEGSPQCALSGGIYGALCYFTGLGCCYSCIYRTKMRAKFNLVETCADCLVHCCCEQCALCQEYRELKNRGYDPALGWIGNEQRQQRGIAMMTPPLNPSMAR